MLLQAVEEGLVGQVEEAGGLSAVAAGMLQHCQDVPALGRSQTQVVAQQRWRCWIARHLLRRFQAPDANSADKKASTDELPELTPREIEVLQLIAKGFSFAEIADMLELSVHTVTTHVKNTYRKLEVRSRGEAVFEAVQRGIVEFKR